jgi:uncharacterized protein with HEPN domain
MPPRDWHVRLEDILEAIAKIQSYIEGMSYEEFAADPKTLDAVIRNLTVIGEAARNVPVELQERYPNVPWREMQGMRNVVVHEYHGVSTFIIWHTATYNLASLPEMLQSILKQAK